jgi:hypothetical protein
MTREEYERIRLYQEYQECCEEYFQQSKPLLKLKVQLMSLPESTLWDPETNRLTYKYDEKTQSALEHLDELLKDMQETIFKRMKHEYTARGTYSNNNGDPG